LCRIEDKDHDDREDGDDSDHYQELDQGEGGAMLHGYRMARGGIDEEPRMRIEIVLSSNRTLLSRRSVAGISIAARYQITAAERRSERAMPIAPRTRSQLMDVLLLWGDGIRRRWGYARILIILNHLRKNATPCTDTGTFAEEVATRLRRAMDRCPSI
jgi:hypothetical protein